MIETKNNSLKVNLQTQEKIVEPGSNDMLGKLEKTIQQVKKAQKIYSSFSQEQVDSIFRKAAFIAASKRIHLAKMAVEETGMGLVEDKVTKNHFASEYIYNKYKDTQTCGVLEKDSTNGIKKYAEPVGVIAGVVPTTNPTSTTIFKALISLKTRNGIIFSPHPRAKKSTVEAAKIVLEAAVEAGAPEGIIGWVDSPSVMLSQYLMTHNDVDLILATGGPGMVKAAYSSGTPAIGVGAGNTPAVIDETADVKMAASSVLMSKTFDHGMICASEQSIVVVNKVYDELKKELLAKGAYLLSKQEKGKIGQTIIQKGHLNPNIVGQPAYKIAKMAGIDVPKETKVLIGEVQTIGEEEPFAYEKLSPILAMYKAEDFKQAISKAIDLIAFGGIGHTSVLYTSPTNEDRIKLFGSIMKTGRVLVNMPASQGAIGDVYNFRLEPSLTLGCGTWGGNSVSENVGIKHLMNIKISAEKRENMLWLQLPPKIYFKTGCLSLALTDIADKDKAFIVTDKPLYDLGYPKKVTERLNELGIDFRIFADVEPDPTLATVKRGLEVMKEFQPDVIISLGGGSPMDAAKIMWLMYEHPDTEFEGLALRFMDIRKRIYQFPKLGVKAQMVAIPTTSGTGAEVTPFAVITDEKTGLKYPIADYELTPNMAIVDPELVMNMPKNLTAYSGIDVLTHGLESIASVFATEFTIPYSLESIKLIFDYLPVAYKEGALNPEAREKVHYASTIAGLAFANGFLGICHSLAHKLGAKFNIAHGLSNGLLIEEVVKFNATDNPRKQTAFPQYKYPSAVKRYAKVAEFVGFKGKTDEESVENLIAKIRELKAALDIPASIKELGVNEKEFYTALDEMSENAFDDQCTGANPRYPSIEEMKQIYIKAYEGK